MALSDSRIISLAREARELEAQIAKLEKKKRKRWNLICREMERRKVTGLEYPLEEEGRILRVAYVQAERNKYLVDKAREVLEPEQFEAIIRIEIDKDKLEAVGLSGAITPQLAATFTEVTKNAPYPRISTPKK